MYTELVPSIEALQNNKPFNGPTDAEVQAKLLPRKLRFWRAPRLQMARQLRGDRTKERNETYRGIPRATGRQKCETVLAAKAKANLMGFGGWPRTNGNLHLKTHVITVDRELAARHSITVLGWLAPLDHNEPQSPGQWNETSRCASLRMQVCSPDRTGSSGAGPCALWPGTHCERQTIPQEWPLSRLFLC
jgi:hypothetical protein